MKTTLLSIVVAIFFAACGGDGGDDEDAAREILDANGVPTGGCSGGNVTLGDGSQVGGDAIGGCNTVAEEEEEDDEDAGEVDDPGDLPRFQTPTPLS